MFNLIPWQKQKDTSTLAPRVEYPLARLRQEFDTLFDRFFGQLPSLWSDTWGAGRWGLDLEEQDKEFVVRAEAPGFEPDDFEVQVSGPRLTIKAESQQGGSTERSHRVFHQSVTLPAVANPEGIEARYRSGVLEVHVPKSPQAQGKRIPVQA